MVCTIFAQSKKKNAGFANRQQMNKKNALINATKRMQKKTHVAQNDDNVETDDDDDDDDVRVERMQQTSCRSTQI